MQPGTQVRSDALACFTAVREAQCTQQAVLTSGAGGAGRRKALIWVDTMLGNVKNAIYGT